ncbi:hypothetical protein BLNAU_781 [Blattamonas nauphoetae]|uniref:C3H1-type domain-containing protein n=1 Tax=Blattamonas nauphoetae TaxID=2049346 RepID=A0ABQ9YKR9_9EUKA|nr:hypothetical protein BLNAU_781 [Blattamonas nauphoetae]
MSVDPRRYINNPTAIVGLLSIFFHRDLFKLSRPFYLNCLRIVSTCIERKFREYICYMNLRSSLSLDQIKIWWKGFILIEADTDDSIFPKQSVVELIVDDDDNIDPFEVFVKEHTSVPPIGVFLSHENKLVLKQTLDIAIFLKNFIISKLQVRFNDKYRLSQSTISDVAIALDPLLKQICVTLELLEGIKMCLFLRSLTVVTFPGKFGENFRQDLENMFSSYQKQISSMVVSAALPTPTEVVRRNFYRLKRSTLRVGESIGTALSVLLEHYDSPSGAFSVLLFLIPFLSDIPIAVQGFVSSRVGIEQSFSSLLSLFEQNLKFSYEFASNSQFSLYNPRMICASVLTATTQQINTLAFIIDGIRPFSRAEPLLKLKEKCDILLSQISQVLPSLLDDIINSGYSIVPSQLNEKCFLVQKHVGQKVISLTLDDIRLNNMNARCALHLLKFVESASIHLQKQIDALMGRRQSLSIILYDYQIFHATIPSIIQKCIYIPMREMEQLIEGKHSGDTWNDPKHDDYVKKCIDAFQRLQQSKLKVERLRAMYRQELDTVKGFGELKIDSGKFRLGDLTKKLAQMSRRLQDETSRLDETLNQVKHTAAKMSNGDVITESGFTQLFIAEDAAFQSKITLSIRNFLQQLKESLSNKSLLLELQLCVQGNSSSSDAHHFIYLDSHLNLPADQVLPNQTSPILCLDHPSDSPLVSFFDSMISDLPYFEQTAQLPDADSLSKSLLEVLFSAEQECETFCKSCDPFSILWTKDSSSLLQKIVQNPSRTDASLFLPLFPRSFYSLASTIENSIFGDDPSHPFLPPPIPHPPSFQQFQSALSISTQLNTYLSSFQTENVVGCIAVDLTHFKHEMLSLITNWIYPFQEYAQRTFEAILTEASSWLQMIHEKFDSSLWKTSIEKQIELSHLIRGIEQDSNDVTAFLDLASSRLQFLTSDLNIVSDGLAKKLGDLVSFWRLFQDSQETSLRSQLHLRENEIIQTLYAQNLKVQNEIDEISNEVSTGIDTPIQTGVEPLRALNMVALQLERVEEVEKKEDEIRRLRSWFTDVHLDQNENLSKTHHILSSLQELWTSIHALDEFKTTELHIQTWKEYVETEDSTEILSQAENVVNRTSSWLSEFGAWETHKRDVDRLTTAQVVMHRMKNMPISQADWEQIMKTLKQDDSTITRSIRQIKNGSFLIHTLLDMLDESKVSEIEVVLDEIDKKNGVADRLKTILFFWREVSPPFLDREWEAKFDIKDGKRMCKSFEMKTQTDTHNQETERHRKEKDLTKAKRGVVTFPVLDMGKSAWLLSNARKNLDEIVILMEKEHTVPLARIFESTIEIVGKIEQMLTILTRIAPSFRQIWRAILSNLLRTTSISDEILRLMDVCKEEVEGVSIDHIVEQTTLDNLSKLELKLDAIWDDIPLETVQTIAKDHPAFLRLTGHEIVKFIEMLMTDQTIFMVQNPTLQHFVPSLHTLVIHRSSEGLPIPNTLTSVFGDSITIPQEMGTTMEDVFQIPTFLTQSIQLILKQEFTKHWAQISSIPLFFDWIADIIPHLKNRSKLPFHPQTLCLIIRVWYHSELDQISNAVHSEDGQLLVLLLNRLELNISSVLSFLITLQRLDDPFILNGRLYQYIRKSHRDQINGNNTFTTAYLTVSFDEEFDVVVTPNTSSATVFGSETTIAERMWIHNIITYLIRLFVGFDRENNARRSLLVQQKLFTEEQEDRACLTSQITTSELEMMDNDFKLKAGSAMDKTAALFRRQSHIHVKTGTIYEVSYVFPESDLSLDQNDGWTSTTHNFDWIPGLTSFPMIPSFEEFTHFSKTLRCCLVDANGSFDSIAGPLLVVKEHTYSLARELVQDFAHAYGKEIFLFICTPSTTPYALQRFLLSHMTTSDFCLFEHIELLPKLVRRIFTHWLHSLNEWKLQHFADESGFLPYSIENVDVEIQRPLKFISFFGLYLLVDDYDGTVPDDLQSVFRVLSVPHFATDKMMSPLLTENGFAFAETLSRPITKFIEGVIELVKYEIPDHQEKVRTYFQTTRSQKEIATLAGEQLKKLLEQIRIETVRNSHDPQVVLQHQLLIHSSLFTLYPKDFDMPQQDKEQTQHLHMSLEELAVKMATAKYFEKVMIQLQGQSSYDKLTNTISPAEHSSSVLTSFEKSLQMIFQSCFPGSISYVSQQISSPLIISILERANSLLGKPFQQLFHPRLSLSAQITYPQDFKTEYLSVINEMKLIEDPQFTKAVYDLYSGISRINFAFIAGSPGGGKTKVIDVVRRVNERRLNTPIIIKELSGTISSRVKSGWVSYEDLSKHFYWLVRNAVQNSILNFYADKIDEEQQMSGQQYHQLTDKAQRICQGATDRTEYVLSDLYTEQPIYFVFKFLPHEITEVSTFAQKFFSTRLHGALGRVVVNCGSYPPIQLPPNSKLLFEAACPLLQLDVSFICEFPIFHVSFSPYSIINWLLDSWARRMSDILVAEKIDTMLLLLRASIRKIITFLHLHEFGITHSTEATTNVIGHVQTTLHFLHQLVLLHRRQIGYKVSMQMLKVYMVYSILWGMMGHVQIKTDQTHGFRRWYEQWKEYTSITNWEKLIEAGSVKGIRDYEENSTKQSRTEHDWEKGNPTFDDINLFIRLAFENEVSFPKECNVFECVPDPFKERLIYFSDLDPEHSLLKALLTRPGASNLLTSYGPIAVLLLPAFILTADDDTIYTVPQSESITSRYGVLNVFKPTSKDLCALAINLWRKSKILSLYRDERARANNEGYRPQLAILRTLNHMALSQILPATVFLIQSVEKQNLQVSVNTHLFFTMILTSVFNGHESIYTDAKTLVSLWKWETTRAYQVHELNPQIQIRIKKHVDHTSNLFFSNQIINISSFDDLSFFSPDSSPSENSHALALEDVVTFEVLSDPVMHLPQKTSRGEKDISLYERYTANAGTLDDGASTACYYLSKLCYSPALSNSFLLLFETLCKTTQPLVARSATRQYFASNVRAHAKMVGLSTVMTSFPIRMEGLNDFLDDIATFLYQTGSPFLTKAQVPQFSMTSPLFARPLEELLDVSSFDPLPPSPKVPIFPRSSHAKVITTGLSPAPITHLLLLDVTVLTDDLDFVMKYLLYDFFATRNLSSETDIINPITDSQAKTIVPRTTVDVANYVRGRVAFLAQQDYFSIRDVDINGMIAYTRDHGRFVCITPLPSPTELSEYLEELLDACPVVVSLSLTQSTLLPVAKTIFSPISELLHTHLSHIDVLIKSKLMEQATHSPRQIKLLQHLSEGHPFIADAIPRILTEVFVRAVALHSQIGSERTVWGYADDDEIAGKDRVLPPSSSKFVEFCTLFSNVLTLSVRFSTILISQLQSRISSILSFIKKENRLKHILMEARLSLLVLPLDSRINAHNLTLKSEINKLEKELSIINFEITTLTTNLNINHISSQEDLSGISATETTTFTTFNQKTKTTLSHLAQLTGDDIALMTDHHIWRPFVAILEFCLYTLIKHTNNFLPQSPLSLGTDLIQYLWETNILSLSVADAEQILKLTTDGLDVRMLPKDPISGALLIHFINGVAELRTELEKVPKDERDVAEAAIRIGMEEEKAHKIKSTMKRYEEQRKSLDLVLQTPDPLSFFEARMEEANNNLKQIADLSAIAPQILNLLRTDVSMHLNLMNNLIGESFVTSTYYSLGAIFSSEQRSVFLRDYLLPILDRYSIPYPTDPDPLLILSRIDFTVLESLEPYSQSYPDPLRSPRTSMPRRRSIHVQPQQQQFNYQTALNSNDIPYMTFPTHLIPPEHHNLLTFSDTFEGATSAFSKPRYIYVTDENAPISTANASFILREEADNTLSRNIDYGFCYERRMIADLFSHILYASGSLAQQISLRIHQNLFDRAEEADKVPKLHLIARPFLLFDRFQMITGLEATQLKLNKNSIFALYNIVEPHHSPFVISLKNPQAYSLILNALTLIQQKMERKLPMDESPFGPSRDAIILTNVCDGTMSKIVLQLLSAYTYSKFPGGFSNYKQNMDRTTFTLSLLTPESTGLLNQERVSFTLPMNFDLILHASTSPTAQFRGSWIVLTHQYAITPNAEAFRANINRDLSRIMNECVKQDDSITQHLDQTCLSVQLETVTHSELARQQARNNLFKILHNLSNKDIFPHIAVPLTSLIDRIRFRPTPEPLPKSITPTSSHIPVGSPPASNEISLIRMYSPRISMDEIRSFGLDPNAPLSDRSQVETRSIWFPAFTPVGLGTPPSPGRLVSRFSPLYSPNGGGRANLFSQPSHSELPFNSNNDSVINETIAGLIFTFAPVDSQFVVEVDTSSEIIRAMEDYIEDEKRVHHSLAWLHTTLSWEEANVRPLLDLIALYSYTSLRLHGQPFSKNTPFLWTQTSFSQVLSENFSLMRRVIHHVFPKRTRNILLSSRDNDLSSSSSRFVSHNLDREVSPIHSRQSFREGTDSPKTPTNPNRFKLNRSRTSAALPVSRPQELPKKNDLQSSIVIAQSTLMSNHAAQATHSPLNLPIAALNKCVSDSASAGIVNIQLSASSHRDYLCTVLGIAIQLTNGTSFGLSLSDLDIMCRPYSMVRHDVLERGEDLDLLLVTIPFEPKQLFFSEFITWRIPLETASLQLSGLLPINPCPSWLPTSIWKDIFTLAALSPPFRPIVLELCESYGPVFVAIDRMPICEDQNAVLAKILKITKTNQGILTQSDFSLHVKRLLHVEWMKHQHHVVHSLTRHYSKSFRDSFTKTQSSDDQATSEDTVFSVSFLSSILQSRHKQPSHTISDIASIDRSHHTTQQTIQGQLTMTSTQAMWKEWLYSKEPEQMALPPSIVPLNALQKLLFLSYLHPNAFVSAAELYLSQIPLIGKKGGLFSTSLPTYELLTTQYKSSYYSPNSTLPFSYFGKSTLEQLLGWSRMTIQLKDKTHTGVMFIACHNSRCQITLSPFEVAQDIFQLGQDEGTPVIIIKVIDYYLRARSNLQRSEKDETQLWMNAWGILQEFLETVSKHNEWIVFLGLEYSNIRFVQRITRWIEKRRINEGRSKYGGRVWFVCRSEYLRSPSNPLSNIPNSMLSHIFRAFVRPSSTARGAIVQAVSTIANDLPASTIGRVGKYYEPSSQLGNGAKHVVFELFRMSVLFSLVIEAVIQMSRVQPFSVDWAMMKKMMNLITHTALASPDTGIKRISRIGFEGSSENWKMSQLRENLIHRVLQPLLMTPTASILLRVLNTVVQPLNQTGMHTMELFPLVSPPTNDTTHFTIDTVLSLVLTKTSGIDRYSHERQVGHMSLGGSLFENVFSSILGTAHHMNHLYSSSVSSILHDSLHVSAHELISSDTIFSAAGTITSGSRTSSLHSALDPSSFSSHLNWNTGVVIGLLEEIKLIIGAGQFDVDALHQALILRYSTGSLIPSFFISLLREMNLYNIKASVVQRCLQQLTSLTGEFDWRLLEVAKDEYSTQSLAFGLKTTDKIEDLIGRSVKTKKILEMLRQISVGVVPFSWDTPTYANLQNQLIFLKPKPTRSIFQWLNRMLLFLRDADSAFSSVGNSVGWTAPKDRIYQFLRSGENSPETTLNLVPFALTNFPGFLALEKSAIVIGLNEMMMKQSTPVQAVAHKKMVSRRIASRTSQQSSTFPQTITPSRTRSIGSSTHLSEHSFVTTRSLRLGISLGETESVFLLNRRKSKGINNISFFGTSLLLAPNTSLDFRTNSLRASNWGDGGQGNQAPQLYSTAQRGDFAWNHTKVLRGLNEPDDALNIPPGINWPLKHVTGLPSLSLCIGLKSPGGGIRVISNEEEFTIAANTYTTIPVAMFQGVRGSERFATLDALFIILDDRGENIIGEAPDEYKPRALRRERMSHNYDSGSDSSTPIHRPSPSLPTASQMEPIHHLNSLGKPTSSIALSPPPDFLTTSSSSNHHDISNDMLFAPNPSIDSKSKRDGTQFNLFPPSSTSGLIFVPYGQPSQSVSNLSTVAAHPSSESSSNHSFSETWNLPPQPYMTDNNNIRPTSKFPLKDNDIPRGFTPVSTFSPITQTLQTPRYINHFEPTELKSSNSFDKSVDGGRIFFDAVPRSDSRRSSIGSEMSLYDISTNTPSHNRSPFNNASSAFSPLFVEDLELGPEPSDTLIEDSEFDAESNTSFELSEKEPSKHSERKDSMDQSLKSDTQPSDNISHNSLHSLDYHHSTNSQISPTLSIHRSNIPQPFTPKDSTPHSPSQDPTTPSMSALSSHDATSFSPSLGRSPHSKQIDQLHNLGIPHPTTIMILPDRDLPPLISNPSPFTIPSSQSNEAGGEEPGSPPAKTAKQSSASQNGSGTHQREYIPAHLISCKFFFSGNCRKGSACPYSHTIPPHQASAVQSRYLMGDRERLMTKDSAERELFGKDSEFRRRLGEDERVNEDILFGDGTMLDKDGHALMMDEMEKHAKMYYSGHNLGESMNGTSLTPNVNSGVMSGVLSNGSGDLSGGQSPTENAPSHGHGPTPSPALSSSSMDQPGPLNYSSPSFHPQAKSFTPSFKPHSPSLSPQGHTQSSSQSPSAATSASFSHNHSPQFSIPLNLQTGLSLHSPSFVPSPLSAAAIKSNQNKEMLDQYALNAASWASPLTGTHVSPHLAPAYNAYHAQSMLERGYGFYTDEEFQMTAEMMGLNPVGMDEGQQVQHRRHLMPEGYEKKICTYHLHGSCKYGKFCWDFHGHQCPKCGMNALHPTDEQQRQSHIQHCHGKKSKHHSDKEHSEHHRHQSKLGDYLTHTSRKKSQKK